jgi:cytochrome c2
MLSIGNSGGKAALAFSALLLGCEPSPPRPSQDAGSTHTETLHPQPPPEHLASADRGLRLMTHYQCASCHEIPRVPGHQDGSGPSLNAFGRRSYIAGHIPNLPDRLQHWLRDPQALVPGSPMPALGVTPRDARDMAAYLHSLK